MKVIGYGICGPGEASRFLRQTLEEFARLCDTVVILCNNTGVEEHNMIDEFGFKRVNDRREWGRFQWRIKQDFIERDIKQIAQNGDMLVCLDMDEVFSRKLTKKWLYECQMDAYHVFVVDLWNDPRHFKIESCFWNVRLWRWNGKTSFKVKPVHCGLAPEWAYLYHRHAPFILKHYGLMLPEERARKVLRYEKYDPKAEHLDKKYYDMLKDNECRPFDEDALQDTVEKEVATYKQTKPKEEMNNQTPKERYAYVKNSHGNVIDIPEKHLTITLKQPGMTFVGWADEQDAEIEALFEDDDLDLDIEESPVFEEEEKKNNYARSTTDEKKEFDALNNQDETELSDDAIIEISIEEESPVNPIKEILSNPIDMIRTPKQLAKKNSDAKKTKKK